MYLWHLRHPRWHSIQKYLLRQKFDSLVFRVPIKARRVAFPNYQLSIQRSELLLQSERNRCLRHSWIGLHLSSMHWGHRTRFQVRTCQLEGHQRSSWFSCQLLYFLWGQHQEWHSRQQSGFLPLVSNFRWFNFQHLRLLRYYFQRSD